MGGWPPAQCQEGKEWAGAKANLPNPHDGVGNEDQEDDKGLHKGGDGLLTLLKPGQHLGSREREDDRHRKPRR